MAALSFAVPAIPRRTRYLIVAIALVILFSGTYQYYGGEPPYWAPGYVDCETRLGKEGIPPTPPEFVGRISSGALYGKAPVGVAPQVVGARLVSATTVLALSERLRDHSLSSLPTSPELSSDPDERDLVWRLTHSLIIHQSWKTPNASEYPLDYAAHSPQLWQARHPGWLYILWSDSDNRRLVESRYSQWLKLYDGMAKGIMRADFVRNLYMHALGGVYADLDVVPLEPMDAHIPFMPPGLTPLSPVPGPVDEGLAPPPLPVEPNPNSKHAKRDPSPETSQQANNLPVVYVARMLLPASSHSPKQQSIPNAWMASTRPGHDLWMRIAARSAKLIGDGVWGPVEGLTGPEPLYLEVESWEKQLEVKLAKGGNEADLRRDLVVLDKERIFPYSWAGGKRTEHCLCSPRYPNTFDTDRCASLYPDAWALSL